MKSAEQVAQILNVDPTYIRRLCRKGRINAAKVGRDWIILMTEKEIKKKPWSIYKKKVNELQYAFLKREE